MKKIVKCLALIMSMCLIQGCACKHKYLDATCVEPSKCELCGETEGEALGHDYKEATCTTPQTCKVCGATSGKALDHSYKDATCTSPKKCTKCGATSGKALGHNYKDATCTSPKKCTKCGATSGNALGHNYTGATCSICGTKNPKYAEVAAKLSEMKQDIKYVSSYLGVIESTIRLIDVTSSSSRKKQYCIEVDDNIINLEKYLANIRKACSGNKDLELLYDKALIDVPALSGTINSYRNSAVSYYTKASRVVDTYNALCGVYCQ